MEPRKRKKNHENEKRTTKKENKIKHYLGDIRDYEYFYKVCQEFKPEFIFHLAAQPLVRDSYENPRETFDVNMIGTLNVMEVIRQMKDTVKVGQDVGAFGL